MIRSMTAFSRVEERKDWGHAAIEIRSVNQRFLELQFRLPEALRHLEPDLRQATRKRLTRGKVEIQLHLELVAAVAPGIEINQGLAKALSSSIQELQQLTGLDGQIEWTRFLQWPDMTSMSTGINPELAGDITTLFDRALNELVSSRRREGKSLRAHIEKRLMAITDQVNQVNEQMPTIIAWQRDRIRHKFEDAQIKPDSERVEQELVMLAQKLDVAEEMDRMLTHIEEFQRILEEGGAIGRRMDFLLQEMNREVNTLGSKSVNTEMTAASVELKVLIEQIREQVQNIE